MKIKIKHFFGIVIVIAVAVVTLRTDFRQYGSATILQAPLSIPAPPAAIPPPSTWVTPTPVTTAAKQQPTKTAPAQSIKKLKKPSTNAKFAGTWAVVEAFTAYGPNGPFTALPPESAPQTFKISFKTDSYCNSNWTDPMDESKPFCEPIILNTDGTITGSRLQAFGGFMKLNGSQLEYIEGGMTYKKYVLQKQK